MIAIGHGSRKVFVVSLLALVIASCGGADGGGAAANGSGEGVSGGDRDAPEDVSNGGVGSGGDAAASFTIGGDSWDFDNLVCIAGPASLDVIASQGMIGVSTDPTVVIKILGDWEGSGDGEIETFDFAMFEGPLTDPDTSWSTTLDTGGASFSVDGNRFTAQGAFDDGLTLDATEEVEGEFEATCEEPIVAPPTTTTTLPDLTESGSVTVGGETYVFTYDPPYGRCGTEGNEGRISNSGVLVDDPSSQIVFTYATAEMSTSGEPALQLIIWGPDGQQLWYSAIGFSGSGTGSIESMSGDATSVTVSGELQRSGTQELAPFTAESTCDQ